MLKSNFLTYILIFFFTLFFYIESSSQNSNKKDPTLFSYGSFEVTQSEFLRGYEKNALAKKPIYTEAELKEYLSLYINYKLKVKAAEDEGIDTLPYIIKEISDYRKQLAQSFLTDKNITEKLIHETYERMTKEIRASHILIALKEDATPADTLKAYNKIMALRNNIINGKSTFATIALTESEDPNAKKNQGDLGYFTAMQMVYPFETTAYNTAIGQISMPVRTKFGYHIVQVNDVRPARGEITVQHILLRIPENATPVIKANVKKQADSIYQLLQNGADFNTIAKKHSEDKNTATHGGLLPAFGTGKMIEEFEEASFSLKNDGDISNPILSNLGFHIIKRVNKKELQSLETIKDQLKKKIEKDPRADVSKLVYLNKLKNQNNFIEHHKNLEKLITTISEDFPKPNWKADSLLLSNKEMLFTINKKKYTQQDFIRYVISNKTKQKPLEKNKFILVLYDNYVAQSLLEYENDQLESKNTEFVMQLKEYRDGILLFDLMEKKVWNAASKDTIGLKAYYENNKEKYKRPESVKKDMLRINDPILKKEIIATANTKEKPKELQLEEIIYEKGANNKVDDMIWNVGETNVVPSASGSVDIYYISEIATGTYKTLKDSRGFIVSGYQDQLEKDWINNLKIKYPIKVNESILNSLIK